MNDEGMNMDFRVELWHGASEYLGVLAGTLEDDVMSLVCPHTVALSDDELLTQALATLLLVDHRHGNDGFSLVRLRDHILQYALDEELERIQASR